MSVHQLSMGVRARRLGNLPRWHFFVGGPMSLDQLSAVMRARRWVTSKVARGSKHWLAPFPKTQMRGPTCWPDIGHMHFSQQAHPMFVPPAAEEKHRILPPLHAYVFRAPAQVDPMVFSMLHEDPGKISYSDVGGLTEQIRQMCASHYARARALLSRKRHQSADNVSL